MSRVGYIGVDLDRTLAKHVSKQGIDTIGEPVAPMVERVKRWLADGRAVRIITARVHGDTVEAETQIRLIEAWCREHIGQVLPVQSNKDYDMLELWDDRAVSVVPNEGVVLADVQYALGKVLGAAELKSYDLDHGIESDAYAVYNDPDDDTGHTIYVDGMTGYDENGFGVTPREARALAASLLRAADVADAAR